MDAGERPPIKVKVMDRRRTTEAAQAERAEELEEPTDGHEDGAEAMEGQAEQVERVEQDLLDDLRRLQAEFDNYRKRVLREQTAMATRASARLVERLLPVLDNLERAVEHGDGGAGTELVLKELKGILEQEGLEDIDAEGAPFDPRVHEAFQVVEDPDVDEPTVRAVYRRGYRLGDGVLRPPMVVIAQPPAADAPAQPAGDESQQQAGDERPAAGPVAPEGDAAPPVPLEADRAEG